MNVAECPSKVVEGDAAGDPGILINIMGIIVVNEVVPDRLSEHGQCQD